MYSLVFSVIFGPIHAALYSWPVDLGEHFFILNIYKTGTTYMKCHVCPLINIYFKDEFKNKFLTLYANVPLNSKSKIELYSIILN